MKVGVTGESPVNPNNANAIILATNTTVKLALACKQDTRTMALYHWWLFLLFFSSLSCQAKIEESLVEVYDNVLDSETAQWLHQECTKWDNPDIVTIFPLKQPHLHTPIEQMLDKILWQIYPNIHEDESPKYYVEFWQRTEWQHILAHADMDGRYIQKDEYMTSHYCDKKEVLTKSLLCLHVDMHI